MAAGIWYNGKDAQRREVTVSCDDGVLLRVQGEAVDVSVWLSAVKIDPPLGSTRRMIRFSDGGVLELTDQALLERWQRRQGTGRFFRALHGWENSLKRAAAAVLLLAAVGYGFTRFAVPVLASKAAFALPARTEDLLGRETLQVLDRLVLKPSGLPAARRGELAALFGRMTDGNARHGWRLEFRSGAAVGANAFALPSGIVVVTDRLVQLAKNDDEIAGVLAHEIGHVNRRHSLRHLMQNSATALLIATVTGDITSVTSLSATLPTLLIDAKYSRDFEVEADDAAVAYLKGRGIPVQSYADMLTRLSADHQKGEKERDPKWGEYLADHPVIQERVQRVLAAR